MEFFLRRNITFLQAELSREVGLRLTELLDVPQQGADVPLQDDLHPTERERARV